jgi:hypothetical protein
MRVLQHNDSEPKAWSKTFHHHVGWDLSGDIEWEEDGQRNIVLDSLWAFPRHAQVLLKTEEFGISNVCTIQKGKTAQVSKGKT